MNRIVYSIETTEGDKLALNSDACNCIEKESTRLSSDEFTFENKVEDKSGEDGSVKLGKTRITGRDLEVSFTRAYDNDEDFDNVNNELLVYLKDAKYLIDENNNRRIPVAIEKYVIEHKQGAYKRLADCSFPFIALSPYWEDVVETEILTTVNGGDINDTLIDTGSFLEVPAIITCTAAVLCATVQMYVSETKQGIEINDSIFGSSGFEEMIIDNAEGVLSIGGLDRTQSIATSTGYFKLPPGSSTLKTIPAEDLDLSIKYRKRYFI